nr:hypothetical protein CFP56_21325 [Quercus suber]
MSISNVRLVVPQLQDSITRDATANDHPNYWSNIPASLISTCDINAIVLGTGHNVYETSIIPAIRQARTEVILVTCFWARSTTLHMLNDALCHLSARALQNDTKIKVRICFSSSSLFQKLLHTSSLEGHTYKHDTLQSELGLPGLELLQGLDLEVKSMFVLPFSVMHPKFVLVDRQQVFLPSCNVSWEDWFEGCVVMSGELVEQFIIFWREFWAGESDKSTAPPRAPNPGRATAISSHVRGEETRLQALRSIPAIFLPSPHHTDPKFSAPWHRCISPPPTPLNLYLLTLFSLSGKSIYIQTPNLTSPPVLSALVSALSRGVDITILTSERLMVLEQLVTAGTTTSRCVKSLVRRHRRLRATTHRRGDDLEAALTSSTIGKLNISYYEPRAVGYREQSVAEPVQSHLKLTIVDDQVVVLGSGNLDRASWFTSQELGVALVSIGVVKAVREHLAVAMVGRSRVVYDE